MKCIIIVSLWATAAALLHISKHCHNRMTLNKWYNGKAGLHACFSMTFQNTESNKHSQPQADARTEFLTCFQGLDFRGGDAGLSRPQSVGGYYSELVLGPREQIHHCSRL